MAEVTLKINGKDYKIGCDPGEEERVHQLGAYIDRQVSAIAGSGGVISEANLLVLAGIIMADELFETKDMLAHAQSQYEAVSQKLEELTEKLEVLEAQGEATAGNVSESVDDSDMADVIVNLAGRIEAIADRLQKN